MKTIIGLILLIFFFSNGYCQQGQEKEAKIYDDTINLPMPKPDKEDIATKKDYEHCIDLTKEGYTVILNGKKYFQSNEQKLSSFIKANKLTISKNLISIISDSKTSYKKIVNAFDIMTQQKIKNYKFLSADGQLPSVPPIVVPTTKAPMREIDLKDSAVFIISVLADTMKVTFLNKTNTCASITDLENFILNNKNVIDPVKVVLTAPSNSKYEEIEPLLELLRKYNYYDYRLIATE